MPRSTWFKALLLFVALWAPLSQAETGWQPIQETIRKSDKDNRQYQAIRLDNGMEASKMRFYPCLAFITVERFIDR
ncbi:hypothetical protein IBK40_22955 [Escherichia coli]|nr:hypothetical protein [Escherichia coli]